VGLIGAFTAVAKKERAADGRVDVGWIIEVPDPEPHDIHPSILGAVAVEIVSAF
jgi:hypothetical protein